MKLQVSYLNNLKSKENLQEPVLAFLLLLNYISKCFCEG